MNPSACPAAKLLDADRINLAVLALAGTATMTDLAAGHGFYRGVVEWMRDLLGVRIGEGTVHNVHQAAARQAGAINCGIDLSPIRVGLHDEIIWVPSPCSAVSAQGRPTAICWPLPNIAMPTPGAFICSTFLGRV